MINQNIINSWNFVVINNLINDLLRTKSYIYENMNTNKPIKYTFIKSDPYTF